MSFNQDINALISSLFFLPVRCLIDNGVNTMPASRNIKLKYVQCN